jgi:hemerythrin-like domain-containing protein
MTHAIEVLRQEHMSMARLLRLMDKLHLELGAGQAPDFPLLNEISDYLRGFPDQCHHPKEDLIYSKLGEREPGLDELGSDLEYEHNRIAKMTQRFSDLLASASGDPEKPLAELMAAMDELTRTYERHMAMEEEHLFPLAIKKLRRVDWDEINSTLFEQDDPLLDEASSRYQRIRDEISDLAEEHDDRNRLLAGHTGLSAELGPLDTLGQLNEILSAQNYDLRLSGSAAGGFQIIENDNVLLEIPACNEARAVWCAYCYVRGRYS